MLNQINKNKFFSIEYTTKDGRTETYLCRGGVRKWKTSTGVKEVQGTGHVAPDNLIRLYCANRKDYRSFILDRIKRVKQGNIIINNLQILDHEN